MAKPGSRKAIFWAVLKTTTFVRSTLATGLFPVIAPARSGGIWIASNQRLLKWEDGCLTTLAEGSAWLPGQNLIQRLFEDHDGVLWIATRRSGLFQLSAGQIRAVTNPPTEIGPASREDSEHGVWVTSFGDGISRLQQQRFEMLGPPPGEAEIASTAVCEDRNGALWCADRSGGVVRYLGGVMLRVNNPHGEQPIYANSVSPDDSGHVWVGAISGLYRTSIDQPSALQSVEPTLKDIHVLHSPGSKISGSAATTGSDGCTGVSTRASLRPGLSRDLCGSRDRNRRWDDLGRPGACPLQIPGRSADSGDRHRWLR